MRKKIYQIYYRDDQKSHMDVAFIPYDNRGRAYPYNFEYAVFFDLFENVNWDETDLLGTVSWKFHQKTGLKGDTLIKHINDNPNKDVYFVNPFPELCVYKSVWEHGNEFHPDLTRITGELLASCGYSQDILQAETPPNLTAYCNYWVGNKKFWEAYVAFIRPVWDYICGPPNNVTAQLCRSADPFINAPYLPFIFERLFSTFLSLNHFQVSSCPVAPEKIENNPFLAPVAERLARISQLETQRAMRAQDRVAINFLSTIRKWRHYYLPLMIRKLRRKYRKT